MSAGIIRAITNNPHHEPSERGMPTSKKKGSHIHRVAHERVQSRRYDFLFGSEFDSCRGKGIFFVHKKYDEEPERDKSVTC